jgi:hypothetical protein
MSQHSIHNFESAYVEYKQALDKIKFHSNNKHTKSEHYLKEAKSKEGVLVKLLEKIIKEATKVKLEEYMETIGDEDNKIANKVRKRNRMGLRHVAVHKAKMLKRKAHHKIHGEGTTKIYKLVR